MPHGHTTNKTHITHTQTDSTHTPTHTVQRAITYEALFYLGYSKQSALHRLPRFRPSDEGSNLTRRRTHLQDKNHCRFFGGLVEVTYPKEEVEEKEQVLDALQSSHGDAKVALVAAKKQQPFFF